MRAMERQARLSTPCPTSWLWPRGDAQAASDRALGDLRALAGVAKFPVRVKCALLPWNALKDALRP